MKTTKEKQFRDDLIEQEAFVSLGKPQIFFGQDGGVRVTKQTKNTVEFQSLDGTISQKMNKNKFFKELPRSKPLNILYDHIDLKYG